MNRIGYVDTTSNVVTFTPNFSGSNNFTSFGEDMNGELYVTNSSVIYKIVDTSTASATSFENSGFSLYPNPSKNSITISSTEASFAKQIQIFDVSGKLLISKEVSQNKRNTIDTTSLSIGVYIVNVTTTDGKNYSSKLIKE